MKFQDGVAPVPTLTGEVSWIQAISGPKCFQGAWEVGCRGSCRYPQWGLMASKICHDLSLNSSWPRSEPNWIWYVTQSLDWKTLVYILTLQTPNQMPKKNMSENMSQTFPTATFPAGWPRFRQRAMTLLIRVELKLMRQNLWETTLKITGELFISQGRRNHMDKIIWLLLGWK